MFGKRALTAVAAVGLGGASMLTALAMSGPAGATSNSASAPGVTATTVTVGQVDDLTAPLPGLFKSAEDGTQAYFNYINSQGGVNGRKIELNAQDSAFNSAQVTSETQNMAKNDFALVGGFSLLDQAQVPVINQTGVPDVAYPLSIQLSNNPHVYSPSPATSNAWPEGALKWFKSKYPQAVKHVGILYGTDTPTEIAIQNNVNATLKALGYDITYTHGITATTTSFLPDVLKMKSEGVQMLYESQLPTQQAATLAKELQQENLKVINVEIAAYAANLPQLAGSAGQGMYFAEPYSLYQGEDASTTPSVATFDKWVKKVDPGVFSSTEPVSALYGWTAAQLFTQALKAAGQNPTRASLTAALNNVTNFSANDLIAPGNPAKNIPPSCWLLAQLNNGKIQRISPSPKSGYTCNPGGNHAASGWKPQTR
ncbi:MAG TPA: ABC transporter substrate-binding protein [Acidimicrobiales bacterium]|nr:ABC transporter substrate-binding protein [Acidimicrobiales bacterium]